MLPSTIQYPSRAISRSITNMVLLQWTKLSGQVISWAVPNHWVGLNMWADPGTSRTKEKFYISLVYLTICTRVTGTKHCCFVIIRMINWYLYCSLSISWKTECFPCLNIFIYHWAEWWKRIAYIVPSLHVLSRWKYECLLATGCQFRPMIYLYCYSVFHDVWFVRLDKIKELDWLDSELIASSTYHLYNEYCQLVNIRMSYIAFCVPMNIEHLWPSG